MICRICSSECSYLASARVLKQYDVGYFRCPNCKFTQTETPYWLAEAYSEPIGKMDIGLIQRNIGLSEVTAFIISYFFDSESSFLDYGGGNGMFVRMMRDKGYNYFGFDKYCQNAFAAGFEADLTNRYEVATAFEVFEHLADPVFEIEQLCNLSDNILFSTMLLPAHDPLPDQWWYFALHGGQHISIYSKESLEALSRILNYKFISFDSNLHLFTKKELPIRTMKHLVKNRHTLLYRMLLKRHKRRSSLISADYQKITGEKWA